jgi:hypothetical protein
MVGFIRLSLAAVALCGVGLRPVNAAAPLQDAPPAETRMFPYSGDVPPCDHSFVLAQIMRDFSDREAEYWNSALAIENFLEPRETGYRKYGLSFIPRRYCEARAALSDGSNHRVTYEIGEGQGFWGLGFGVKWRVQGLDREHESSFGR